MIKNTYIRCALVLGCICVGSAALIGGLHYVTESYKATHKSTKAPAEIQDLKPGATFEEVTTPMPAPIMGDNTKVTITAIYALKDGNKTTGYAYMLNCGKPVKTELTCSVLFEGAATEATKNSLKPTAVNVIVGGDAGYDTNVIKLGESIVAGTVDINKNQSEIVMSGGTNSQKFFLDGVKVARNDYVNRINGTSGEPVKKTPVEDIYGESYKSSVENTTFTKLEATTSHCTYEITKLYTVTLKDSTTTWAYDGIINWVDPEGETDTLKLTAAFSGNKSDVKFDGYKVTQNVSYSQYKSWLDAVKTGEKSIDGDDIIEAGGTMTLNAVKDAIRGMRDHFAANYKTVLEGMYGESYVSESVDTFTTLEGTTSHCSYKITKRYSVALTTGSGKAYEATVSFQDPEDETDTTKFIAAFSGDASNVKLVGYKITQKINFEQYTSWIDKLTSGEKTLDDTDYVGTGATMSLNAVRDTLLAMRADYIASLGE
ncbi:MAG: hypothetical protein MJ238_00830 [Bacilli bacterium]|nr:hypothetical protein [Bacilli bacterium]